MKREIAITFSVATLSLAMLSPGLLQAQSNDNSQPSQTAASTQDPQNVSIDMVSARVALTETIDTRKVKPGDQVHATLSDKVSLKNGTRLPAGTKILGVVAEDDMQFSGASKLAINFNQAQLKDGTVIPIKTTMVGIYPEPGHLRSSDRSGRPGDAGLVGSSR
jgi:hypothetical protein